MADEIKRNAPRPGFAEKVTKCFVVEKTTGKSPDGHRTTSLSSTDANFTQAKADARWKEMKSLIDAGKFKLIETRQQDGGKCYLYEFILSDGQRIVHGSNRALEQA